MPLIYMANECLDTSKALKSSEEIQGCFCVRGGQLESFNGVGFLLFTVTLRPPELVLEQSCDMLFRVFLNTEGTLYQKCLIKLMPQSKKRDILHKTATKNCVLQKFF